MVTPASLSAQRAALTPTSIPRATAAPALTQRGNAKLGPAEAAGAYYVMFDFNPAAIVITHMAPVMPSAGLRHGRENGAQDGGDSGNVALVTMPAEEVERAKGTTSIAMRSLTFDGGDVERNCLRLLSWTHFQPVTDPASEKKTELPRLKFVWGPQIYLVHLNQVTITYTRFSRSGMPVRAAVDLTLHSIPNIPGPTNPSSGGLPGRRTHLLAGAESLPELATRCYGGPGRWREIAAANRFEDPLRVRPGTQVYLPSTQETGR
ncbi:hypothetical protein [Streptacidiphilus sp. EB129]|uniref:CIS tube protein n=1 Tax=Streptacidiphilus sp. EB129 TaxID=3156262 RepID=UPI003518341B